MKYNQNFRISQVTNQTLVVGVDIAKKVHYARAFDSRGIELGKCFGFKATSEGFKSFIKWTRTLEKEQNMEKVIIGIEPTGHYWFTFAQAVNTDGMILVQVNPYHVKCSKELDDNTPSKSDYKDPKTIAFLVKDGRYRIPYLPKDEYAELRKANNMREEWIQKKVAVKNRIIRWLDTYFPEFMDVFSSWEGKAALMTLGKFAFPSEISNLTPEEILASWRIEAKRGVGIRKAKELLLTAQTSIGIVEGNNTADYEIKLLIREHTEINEVILDLENILEKIVLTIPGAKNLLEIKGVGIRTVAGFFAEIGDIRRFESAKQIIKLAGLNLRFNSSGDHKGETTITKRGRSRLRAILFRTILPLVATNEVFNRLHHDNMNRKDNPLKPKQSLIALCCRFIRIAFALITKNEKYDEKKLLSDIYRCSKEIEVA
jgi:transposase